jgi:MFS family permease
MGWMFDGFEMGLFPLIGRPALRDLLSRADASLPAAQIDAGVNLWLGIMTAVFLVGAATGGVVFGWLGDRLGRVRAMTLSVLTYTLFMGLCGFSATVGQAAVLRFIAALGMGGEWSLGVALVMESWPNRSRAFLAGLIGAASNVGFLTVALVGLSLGKLIDATRTGLLSVGVPTDVVNYLIVDSQGDPTGWRLMMLFGALPAVLTFFIRLMVPESERWLESKEQGAAQRWATRDMLGVLLGAVGAVSIILLWSRPLAMPVRLAGSAVGFLVALIGFTYPVIRFLQRDREFVKETAGDRATVRRMLLGACFSGVALIGTWASIQNAPSWADKIVERDLQQLPAEQLTARRSDARAATQICSAIGAIIGTIAAALLGDAIGRRPAYALLCVLSLLSSLAFFQLNTHYGWPFLALVLVAGGVTASFYGWLPLYLPELFSTRVRATAQGFSFNFGRILAAIGALQFGYLMKEVFQGDFVRTCSTLSLVYLIGVVIIWFAPETKGQPLPD